VGPVCLERRKAWLLHLAVVGHEGAELGEIRAGEDVVCTLNRATGNLDTNIVRKFSWCGGDKVGYGFSEPQATDLAFNILGAFLGSGYIPLALGAKFAETFIHHLPPEGAVLKRKDILEWLAENNANPTTKRG
jgi:hypothetical protein